jgi:hypothetical protein
MKKIFKAIFVVGALAVAMISCDEGIVSKKHDYTEEELLFRDSLEAARNNVKANFVIVTEVDLPFDAEAYSGVEVEVDTDVVLQKLGYATLADLTEAFGTLEGGVQTGNEVTFFAINKSTGYDHAGYTANGLGHWFDGAGDVVSWGEPAQLYSEFNQETFTFFIGQFPDKLVEGETYKIIQAVKKGSYRLAFVFNITVGAPPPDYVDPETPPAGVPKTVEKTYEVEQTFANDWSANSRIDVKETLRDAFKMTTYQIHKAIENDELVFSGVNADGSIYKDGDGNPVSTANHPGHWFALNGNVTTWGDVTNKPFVYSEFGHDNALLEFSIGLHPENAKAGDETTIKQIAELNGGKVTLIFKFKVK